MTLGPSPPEGHRGPVAESRCCRSAGRHAQHLSSLRSTPGGIQAVQEAEGRVLLQLAHRTARSLTHFGACRQVEIGHAPKLDQRLPLQVGLLPVGVRPTWPRSAPF